MLTAERLRELLHYDPETGVFTWRVANGRRVQVGTDAGYIDHQGYRRIRIDYALYRGHRLAWLHVHGEWPVDQIDHVNGARDDNRIANLRECTCAENQQNRSVHVVNTSGYPGVSRHKQSGKWVAHISLHSRRKYLGIFTSPEAAAEAYRIAKAKYHTFNPETRSTS